MFVKNFIRKINALPLFTSLFCILLFYLPFQYRYEHLVKKLLYPLFSPEFNTFLRIDGSLGIYLTDFLMIAMILPTLISQSLRSFFWEKSRKYLTFFLFISLLSLLHCPHGLDAWAYYPYLFQLLIPTFFFFALSSRLDLKAVMDISFWIIFSIAILESIFAITQYTHQRELGLTRLGEPQLFAVINMPDCSKWALDSFFHTKTLSEEIFRAAGTLPHPNILGTFLGFTLLVSYYLYLQLQKNLSRALFSVGLFLQWMTLFLTYSRAGLIGMAIGSICWFGYFIYKKIPYSKTLAVKTLICISLSFAILMPQIVSRGGILNYNSLAQDSDRGRHIYQERAIKQIKEHPLLGIGFHQSLVVLKENQEKGDAVHNIYLLIAAENGLIGLAVFLCFICSILWHTIRTKMDGKLLTLLGIFLFLLFTGCCHYDLIKSQQGRLLFFISAALLTCYTQVDEKASLQN